MDGVLGGGLRGVMDLKKPLCQVGQEGKSKNCGVVNLAVYGPIKASLSLSTVKLVRFPHKINRFCNATDWFRALCRAIHLGFKLSSGNG